ncbi:MAG: EpsG family protein [Bacteroidales bacterium]|nr:EpsG family protein [Bacteroidales bacterium]
MLQSFFVYSITALLLFIFGSVAAKRERINNSIGKPTSFWTWEVVFSLLIFALISGIRWQVGVDHQNYLNNFRSLQQFGYFADPMEKGFEYITSIFTTLDIHFVFYFAFWAFLQLFFVYYAVRNERYLLPFLGIVILLGPHYLSWMNGIRQMLVATIFVFSIQLITKRKLLPYLITILLASTIHKSAILLLIFYFIPKLDYFKNRYINIGLLIATLIIGFTPAFMNAISFFENILAFIGYDRYAARFDIMLEYEREMNLGPRRLSILFLNIESPPKSQKAGTIINSKIFVVINKLSLIT